MMSQKVKLVEGGKLVIPAAFRRELGLVTGDTVIVEMDGGELRLRSQASAVRMAQDLVRTINPEARSMVEELIDERRQQADRE